MSDNRPTREECEDILSYPDEISNIHLKRFAEAHLELLDENANLKKQLAEHDPQFDVGERVVFLPFPDQRGAVTECDVFGSVTVALDDGCTGNFPIRDLVAECCLREYDKTAAAEKIIRGSGYSTHPEDICQECGGVNVVWFAPNDIWSAVVGSEAGILCPSCFIQKANAKGLYQGGGWRLSPEYQEGQRDELRSENANLKRDKERQWMPIETAPKDGTRVSLFDSEIWIGQWISKDDCNLNEDGDIAVGWTDFHLTDELMSVTHAPTHWQPLPDPPTMESTASEGAPK